MSRARTASQLNLDGPQQCLKIDVVGLGTPVIVDRICNLIFHCEIKKKNRQNVNLWSPKSA